jgi:hypothetical protein
MLQVIAAEESTFPYRGDIEFTDLELGERLVVSASAVDVAYRDQMAAFLDRSRRLAHHDNVDFALMRTDQPPDTALRRYLLERAARHRAGRAAARPA